MGTKLWFTTAAIFIIPIYWGEAIPENKSLLYRLDILIKSTLEGISIFKPSMLICCLEAVLLIGTNRRDRSWRDLREFLPRLAGIDLFERMPSRIHQEKKAFKESLHFDRILGEFKLYRNHRKIFHFGFCQYVFGLCLKVDTTGGEYRLQNGASQPIVGRVSTDITLRVFFAHSV